MTFRIDLDGGHVLLGFTGVAVGDSEVTFATLAIREVHAVLVGAQTSVGAWHAAGRPNDAIAQALAVWIGESAPASIDVALFSHLVQVFTSGFAVSVVRVEGDHNAEASQIHWNPGEPAATCAVVIGERFFFERLRDESPVRLASTVLHELTHCALDTKDYKVDAAGRWSKAERTEFESGSFLPAPLQRRWTALTESQRWSFGAEVTGPLGVAKLLFMARCYRKAAPVSDRLARLSQPKAQPQVRIGATESRVFPPGVVHNAESWRCLLFQLAGRPSFQAKSPTKATAAAPGAEDAL